MIHASHRRWSLAAILALSAWPAEAADWKVADGPLLTRWAKDVRPDNPLPEYPRPQLVRAEWQNLNGLWQLGFGKVGDAPPVGKTLDRQILVPYPVESALSGVMKHADRLWYRRTFSVPQGWTGRRVLLHFGAVDWEATAWVNGKELGTHKGGYDGFRFDVTDALKAGGENELIVRVFDPTDAGTQPRGKQVTNPGGIFYTPTTGIWQTVWLEPVAKQASIARLKITADPATNRVEIAPEIDGDPSSLNLEVGLVDGTTSPPFAGSNGTKSCQLQLPAGAKTWTPESPFLYSLTVRLMKGGQVVDSVGSYFGMRKIEVAKDEKGVNRIKLNGQPIFQVGPLDQGFWPDGLYTAPTDEALRYDVEITKKLGFNMTRKHVKVEPDRWYYWCDKLGLLVWQDMAVGDQMGDRSLKTTGVVCHCVGYARPIQSPSMAGRFMLVVEPRIMLCKPLLPPISTETTCVMRLLHTLASSSWASSSSFPASFSMPTVGLPTPPPPPTLSSSFRSLGLMTLTTAPCRRSSRSRIMLE